MPWKRDWIPETRKETLGRGADRAIFDVARTVYGMGYGGLEGPKVYEYGPYQDGTQNDYPPVPEKDREGQAWTYGKNEDYDSLLKEINCHYLVKNSLEKCIYSEDPEHAYRYGDWYMVPFSHPFGAGIGDILMFDQPAKDLHEGIIFQATAKGGTFEGGQWGSQNARLDLTGLSWECNGNGEYSAIDDETKDILKWQYRIFRPARKKLVERYDPDIPSKPGPAREAKRLDPLLLDLDGGGIKTVGLSADIHFDFDGNGFDELTGWVAPGDGLLILDRNGNGELDDASELFGDFLVLPSGL